MQLRYLYVGSADTGRDLDAWLARGRWTAPTPIQPTRMPCGRPTEADATARWRPTRRAAELDDLTSARRASSPCYSDAAGPTSTPRSSCSTGPGPGDPGRSGQAISGAVSGHPPRRHPIGHGAESRIVRRDRPAHRPAGLTGLVLRRNPRVADRLERSGGRQPSGPTSRIARAGNYQGIRQRAST